MWIGIRHPPPYRMVASSSWKPDWFGGWINDFIELKMCCVIDLPFAKRASLHGKHFRQIHLNSSEPQNRWWSPLATTAASIVNQLTKQPITLACFRPLTEMKVNQFRLHLLLLSNPGAVRAKGTTALKFRCTTTISNATRTVRFLIKFKLNRKEKKTRVKISVEHKHALSARLDCYCLEFTQSARTRPVELVEFETMVFVFGSERAFEECMQGSQAV